jgi:heat shock protein HslJ
MGVRVVWLGIVGLTLAALSVGGCSNAPQQDLALLEGDTWVAVQMRADGTGLSPVTHGVRSTIRFADGTIGGNGGVNQYGGNYDASDDGSLTIKMGASTLMAGSEPAMKQEALFFALLPETRSFVVTPTSLELRDEKGSPLVRFSAVAATPLAGTTWICSAVNNGAGGVVTIVADSRIDAVFGDEGQVSGSSGVNRYHGPYEADGESIEIGPLASTRMAGPAELMEQEQQYLKALEKVTRYVIDDATLTLYGGEDGTSRMVTYAAE